MNYTKGGFPVWDEEFDKEHFTPEEIAESNIWIFMTCIAFETTTNQGEQSP